VAKTKILSPFGYHSPATMAGLFLFVLLLISGCQTNKSPEQVTQSFWQALAQGQVENAKKYVTQDSQHLVNPQDIDKFSTIKTNAANIDEEDARVETTITRNKQIVTFDTVLQKENDAWKVDYLQTQINISMLPLGDVIKSLQNLGGTFAKQLEKQLPLLQKEMESLGKDLKDQIDQFNRSLEKSIPPGNTKPPPPGTI
jgi:hypothetical protein